MTIFSWKSLRLLIIGTIIACNIWLAFWIMPYVGCFHVAKINTESNDAYIALVSVVDGKYTNIVSLNNVTAGWNIFKELWPVLLLGALFAFPLGELVRWHVSLDELIDVAERKHGVKTVELFLKKIEVESVLKKAIARTTELPKLKEEVQELRVKLRKRKGELNEQAKEYRATLKKVQSLEKELTKSRAQVRRLKKKQSSGKSLDVDF